ncbi:MAG: cystathionine beta-synthase [Acidimicrobiaceae bacterium]|nr:cystathionine beta-synthase [Acidimicrobiia bacterium]MCY4494300.1 cystathionine beta-synthase [Acidimicrobiaceae bacterium]
MEIHDSVLDMVGNTPLVKLRRISDGLPCPVVAKIEAVNPGGSSKDRPAIAMIDTAEREGLLQPGGTIVEPTSGNTGVGLAIVAAQRGYRCIFVVTSKVGAEKVDLLRAYGAEVVTCPVAVAPDDPASYYSTAARLVKEIPGAFRPDQYHNPANPQAHLETTGPELWRQTDGRITHFVAGAGTGGTLSGVGRYLKDRNPDVQIIAADPEGSVFSGGSGRPYLVEGIGEDFFPDTYDASIIDRTIAVSDRDSFLTAREVTESEGLLIGGSCGTAVNAAVQVARGCGPDDLVVVLLPDNGRLYLSTVFNDEWMAGFGFLRGSGPVVAEVLDSRRQDVPDLLYVQPDATVSEAVQMMGEHGVSQLPVAKGEMPLANAEVMGSVSELRIMDLAFGNDSVLDKTVYDIMGPKLRTVGSGQPIALAVEMLESCSALLVLDGGRPRAVVSSSDVLSFLSKGDFGG